MKKQMNGAIESMERLLSSMQKSGAHEATFDYCIDSMGLAGMGQAVLFEDSVSSAVQRLTLCLETRKPGCLPQSVAQFTVMNYREATGSLNWRTEPVLQIDPSADPAFATALCIASSNALAPKAPSLLNRLFGRRNKSESSVPKPNAP